MKTTLTVLCFILAISQTVMGAIIVEEVVTNVAGETTTTTPNSISVDVGDIILVPISRRDSGDFNIATTFGTANGVWNGRITNSGSTTNTDNSLDFLTITQAGTITDITVTHGTWQSLGILKLSTNLASGSLSYLGFVGAEPALNAAFDANFNSLAVPNASDQIFGMGVFGGGGNPNLLWQNRTGDATSVFYDVSNGARGAAYSVQVDGNWDLNIAANISDGGDGILAVGFAEVIPEPSSFLLTMFGCMVMVALKRRRRS
jgi:hypothetical protein